jgi:hypothetical protein
MVWITKPVRINVGNQQIKLFLHSLYAVQFKNILCSL